MITITKLLQDLEEIKKRLSEATPGPWVATANPMRHDRMFVHKDVLHKCYNRVRTFDGKIPKPPETITPIQLPRADAQLIANAPTDLAKLIQGLEVYVERLREAEEALQHCIRRTGGYTGGKPQEYFSKYGIKIED